MTKSPRIAKSGQISYTLKRSKPGQSVISDVVLPNGEIIRRIDENLHRRALLNAAKAFKEKA